MENQKNNFKIKCIKDCYGVLDILLYKKDNIYIFIDGVCIKEDGSQSMDYSSFENFIQFNGGWKDCFIEITD